MLNSVPSSLPAAAPSSSSSSTPPLSTPFVLKEALLSTPHPELTYEVLTKMPTEGALQELDVLDAKTRELIIKALRNVHGYVIDRPYKENEPDFFIHTAADVLYETETSTTIMGKSHAEKAANHHNSVSNALAQIKWALNRSPSHEQLDVLSKFESVLKVHKHALSSAVQRCDDTVKSKLKKAPRTIITESDRKNVKKVLPKSPTKTPYVMKKTPKKLSQNDQRAAQRLRGSSAIKIPAFSLSPSISSGAPITMMFTQLSLSTSPSQSFVPQAACSSSTGTTPPSSPKRHP